MTGDLFKVDVPSSVSKNKLVYEKLDHLLASVRDPANALGWLHLPDETVTVKEVKGWLKKVKKNQTTCCVLGIGGSCLGAKAVHDFLEPAKQLLFFDNIDGYSFESQLKKLSAKPKLKNCHFIAISKSGETSETLFQLAYIFELLKKNNLKFSDHVTVITEDKPSSLKTIATDFKLPCLNVPFDVGGRFSVFTTVGLAPLMWAGVPIQKLLDGASWAKTQRDAAASLATYYLNGFEQFHWISIFWSYSDALRTFGLWLEQLWAESLGKAKTKGGTPAPRTSTPITCIGATDQHSLLQQFTEGAKDKQFLFIRCEDSEKSSVLKKPIHPKFALTKGRSLGELLGIEASATQKILSDLNVSTARLTVKKHSPETMGALMFLFEMVVATIGESLDINAFDQPGVEAVKKVTLGTLGDARYRDHALDL